MTECKGYKFGKGELLESSSFGEEDRYRLHITDDKGTVIAKVDPAHMKYIEEVSPFLPDTTNESLRVEGWPGDYGIKDFFIKFENGKFVLTGKRINTKFNIDNFTLTEYGEELLSECFPSTLEYHAPANDFTDHSSGQEGCETYNDEPLAKGFDLL